MAAKTQYMRKYGKLIRSWTIVVDEELYRLVREARDAGFDTNAWARDLIRDHARDLREAAKEAALA
jgi:hypothetical protein